MLERLSWKRLALELALLSARLTAGADFRLSALVPGLRAGCAGVEFLQPAQTLPLAVDRPQHDAAARPLELGAAVLWPVSDAAAQSPPPARAGAADQALSQRAESLPDAVVMTTVEGNIFWCNGLAQHLLGFRWPEDNGQHILNLLRYPNSATTCNSRSSRAR